MQPDYDFIMNSGNSPKKKGLTGLVPQPQNKTQRILFVIVGGFALLTVLLVVFSLLLGGGGGNKDKMLSLAQKHAEIIRVSEIGIEKARGPDAKNLAATAKLALQSTQADLIEAVSSSVKVGDKELTAGENTETDKALEIAEQRNRFDEEFIATLRKQLEAYRAELKEVHDASSSESSKQVYADIFTQVTALLPEAATQTTQ